ncbi:(Fe-S)-binding protein [Desulfobotulus sp.]|uniref:(Fe-S)-binding protein n=1 Tax=Desulfobotulus sp. TaxID=1940337 RepID=UPI002A36744E|nr:(Fe-S)-binding protein [Desulfobotulus sp.]MDY0163185.1 (Fe-S)-binding protein [Desulfobotulus sp.]
MEPLIAPAQYSFMGIPTVLLSILIPIVGIALFTYIMAKRVAPLTRARKDDRFDAIPQRLWNVLMIWLGQVRQPRYMMGGVLHILIFFGFLTLALRSMSLVVIGVVPDFALPGFGPDQIIGMIYNVAKDYAATVVFVACFVAAIRRGIFRPERYEVPARFGKDHTAEAVFVLCVIMTLMVSEALFEATLIAAQIQTGAHAHFLAPGTLPWVLKNSLLATPLEKLQTLHVASYFIHDFTFFFFLCFLPLGKHFHVITSLFNVYFMRIRRGNIKPIEYGLSAEEMENLKSIGVKKLEDFTWKHILDFYTCADCGRCSDQCPANTVGRALSPRFISIKGREAVFNTYPLMGPILKSDKLVGHVYEEDEIWSCTTCGACEQECPIGIEYIDKIVDLRRGLVDEGEVPQTLQKPMQALSKRGNAWGKMEKKRADWTKDIAEECPVKVLEGDEKANTLYFVDSISSFDDRMVNIAKSTAKLLKAAGEDFGVLGKNEKDSGNEVIRFGEEFLYQELKNHNVEMIKESGAKRIVTADPHAFNALKNDYKLSIPVEHISSVVTRAVKVGKIKLKPVEDATRVFTYHDPCYLGRHNGVYEDPRAALNAIPGIRTVEMLKSGDRSFCCSGGGLMLFYEPHEEERMAVLRVKMAAKAGANVIVTACPFCLVNMEDAIKVAGYEGKMEALDLVELIEKHMVK